MGAAGGGSAKTSGGNDTGATPIETSDVTVVEVEGVEIERGDSSTSSEDAEPIAAVMANTDVRDTPVTMTLAAMAGLLRVVPPGIVDSVIVVPTIVIVVIVIVIVVVVIVVIIVVVIVVIIIVVVPSTR